MEVIMYYCILSLILVLTTKHVLNKKTKKLPPSPPALPIIGHLHLLRGRIHRSLQTLSQKYGPIMYLQLGARPTLVITSPSIAEELFTKCDVAFANRPNFLSAIHLTYNCTTVGFAPYGDYWRNIRRAATIHIFSSQSLYHSSSTRTEEIRHCVRNICLGEEVEAWREVNLTTLLRELAFDVMMRMVGGKRWPASFEDAFKVIHFMDICDCIPVLKWIGFGGHEKRLIRAQKKRDELLQNLLDEGRRNPGRNSGLIDKQNVTIVESLLALQEAEPEYYTDEVLKGMLLVMFTAGTDPTSLTMQWAMSLMLNHPNVLEKARNEIDNNVTQGRLLEDNDLPNLQYLRCIIYETLRLFPVSPLLLPHSSSKDCIINGYNIPAGTDLLVNAWSIHRNPDVWEDALQFKPERFEGIKMGDEGFRFFPFGKGRRACPGTNLAMTFVSLALGTFIQCFEWKRIRGDMVDLEEKGGILFIQRDKPLQALYKPRFAAHQHHYISPHN